MKQRIVLTESKLRNMIKEVVIQTLNEGKIENNKPFDNPLSNSHWNDKHRR